ncbi:hypothetical protein ACETIH_18030 [Microvirga arabica]|uniref:Uncharacterized protein n=1 Tax=Microvirga arabica TaxID=1128671 RepID=A0ABV6YBA9_9HYPH
MPKKRSQQQEEKWSFGTYEELEAQWEQVRTGRTSDLHPEGIDRGVTAGRLLDELTLLYDVTRDVRFYDARKALWQSGLLTSRGAWRKNFGGARAALASKGYHDNVVLVVWSRAFFGYSKSEGIPL